MNATEVAYSGILPLANRAMRSRTAFVKGKTALCLFRV